MPLIIIMAEFELVSMSSEHKDKILFLEKMKYGTQIFGEMFNMRRLFAPSTIGAIVGFAVVQEVVIGDKAPLRVVQDSAALLGEAAIPTVTLVVIVYLKSTLK
ncbi:Protein PIN-LIKES 1 [Linum perenne]